MAEADTKAVSGTTDFSMSIQDWGGWPWFGAYGAMWRRQPAVRSIVDFLARNIAQLNLKVYERVDDTDRVEVHDHRLAQLVRSPNPRATRFRLLRDTVSSASIYDRAYWRKIRQRGRLVAIVHVSPMHVMYEQVPNGVEPRYQYRIGQEVVPRDDLVIFPGYSPEGGEVGVSPLETLRRVLDEDQSAVRHRAGYWRNATRQSGVIQRPLEAPEWGETARDRFRADWEASFSGEHGAGRTPVLEDGMIFNPSAFSPKDSLYVEGRELTYREVAMAYFGPMVGRAWIEQTGAGTAENHRQVYQDVLGPWLAMLEDEIALQLLPEVEDDLSGRVYCEFNLAEKMKGSFEEQAKTLTSSVGVPFMAVSEARARMNLPHIDDEAFDVPVQPLNVLYGGQAAVTIPTATPGTPPPPPAMAAVPPPPGPPPPIPLASAIKAAPRGAVRRRDEAADGQAATIRRFLERQGAAVVSLLGARKAADDGVDLEALWARERWNRELGDELLRAAIPLATVSGQAAARQITGVYSVDRTIGWLTEDARIAAERINGHTLEDLRQALADADSPVAAGRDVFASATAGRADQLGLSRATSLINWARNEAGRQSSEADGRLRTKTWVVTSANSRHREWNGITVPVGRKFPNGADHPGDWVLGVEQVAGCRCLMDLRYVRS